MDEIIQKIEKLYGEDKMVKYLLSKEDYTKLYSYLYNDYEKCKSIPNEIVIKYLKKKDCVGNLELHMEIDKLYEIAKTNKEKVDLFLEYENLFKENFNEWLKYVNFKAYIFKIILNFSQDFINFEAFVI